MLYVYGLPLYQWDSKIQQPFEKQIERTDEHGNAYLLKIQLLLTGRDGELWDRLLNPTKDTKLTTKTKKISRLYVTSNEVLNDDDLNSIINEYKDYASDMRLVMYNYVYYFPIKFKTSNLMDLLYIYDGVFLYEYEHVDLEYNFSYTNVGSKSNMLNFGDTITHYIKWPILNKNYIHCKYNSKLDVYNCFTYFPLNPKTNNFNTIMMMPSSVKLVDSHSGYFVENKIIYWILSKYRMAKYDKEDGFTSKLIYSKINFYTLNYDLILNTFYNNGFYNISFGTECIYSYNNRTILFIGKCLRQETELWHKFMQD